MIKVLSATFSDAVNDLLDFSDVVGTGNYISVLDNATYQSSDYQPFGALVPPDGSSNPVNWTSKEGLYNKPLFYEPPRLEGYEAPYQARLGELHSQDGLAQLFAQSYGTWDWSWNDDTNKSLGGFYQKNESDPEFLSVPSDECEPTGAIRESATNQPCYIAPKITEVQINDKSIGAVITEGIGLAKLEFSTFVDPDQLPITAYVIGWQDGERSKVSGVNLRNRTNPDNPFLLYHLYDFWKVKEAVADDASGSCSADTCNIDVKITVYDNWNKSTSTEVSLTIEK